MSGALQSGNFARLTPTKTFETFGLWGLVITYASKTTSEGYEPSRQAGFNSFLVGTMGPREGIMRRDAMGSIKVATRSSDYSSCELTPKIEIPGIMEFLSLTSSTCRPMINLPPPLKGLNMRILMTIPVKGRGFINHALYSALNLILEFPAVVLNQNPVS